MHPHSSLSIIYLSITILSATQGLQNTTDRISWCFSNIGWCRFPASKRAESQVFSQVMGSFPFQRNESLEQFREVYFSCKHLFQHQSSSTGCFCLMGRIQSMMILSGEGRHHPFNSWRNQKGWMLMRVDKKPCYRSCMLCHVKFCIVVFCVIVFCVIVKC